MIAGGPPAGGLAGNHDIRADVVARLRGRRIHVLGLSGTEGSTVVDFLLAHGITTITAHDLAGPDAFPGAFRRTHQWMTPDEQTAALERLARAPITRCFGDRYLDGIDAAEIIYVTQAWFRHAGNEPVRRARDRGVPLSSMTALFFETVPCPIVGVTGTNGKFTVVRLAAMMLARSGRATFETGNDRTHVPILYRLAEVTPEAVLVVEISNRQLVGLGYSPHVAVVTNVAAHHLDDHGSFEAYAETKRGILAYQGAGDWALLNGDDPVARGFAAGARGRVLFSSRTRPIDEGACVVDGRIVLRLDGREDDLADAHLQSPGTHTLENALAAALAARVAGADAGAIGAVLREFRGLPHRLALIAEAGGVRYYEDSLATNPAAAAAAVRAFDGPLVLLAGGMRRNASAQDFAPVAEALAARTVRGVVLFGTMAPLLAEAIAAAGVTAPVVRCTTLDEAVPAARALAQPGDAVSLSPSCESFDQYRDYRHRAEHYQALVEALARDDAEGAATRPSAGSRDGTNATGGRSWT
ncbi:MAG TPA: UDP-N-acetylmuramoyl-L-alanine--D-glutamate ligase [bacterium]|nr:UDP-N-acetylmuramoyl-L-alanine--D-glutamate ligase [bacterium]